MELGLVLLVPIFLFFGIQWLVWYFERDHIRSFVKQKGWEVLRISLSSSWPKRQSVKFQNTYNVVYKDNLGKKKKTRCIASFMGLEEWDVS